MEAFSKMYKSILKTAYTNDQSPSSTWDKALWLYPTTISFCPGRLLYLSIPIWNCTDHNDNDYYRSCSVLTLLQHVHIPCREWMLPPYNPYLIEMLQIWQSTNKNHEVFHSSMHCHHHHGVPFLYLFRPAPKHARSSWCGSIFDGWRRRLPLDRWIHGNAQERHHAWPAGKTRCDLYEITYY